MILTASAVGESERSESRRTSGLLFSKLEYSKVESVQILDLTIEYFFAIIFIRIRGVEQWRQSFS